MLIFILLKLKEDVSFQPKCALFNSFENLVLDKISLNVLLISLIRPTSFKDDDAQYARESLSRLFEDAKISIKYLARLVTS